MVTTAAPDEIARFQAMADAWWDAEGDAAFRDYLARHARGPASA